MNKNLTLTIIVPVYNEEDNLQRVGKELSDYLSRTKTGAKILFVNDGSTDRSAEMIESLCDENPLFSYIHFKKNAGLSAALKAGFDHTETKYAGYIDSDLQTSPDDFDLLMEFADDYAMVSGIRMNRKDSFVKNISSKIANSIRRSFTHDGVSDTGCPLKIIRTDIAKKIPFFKGMHRFLAALVQLEDGKVKEVPVRHFPRIAGKSKYHLWNRLLGPTNDLFAYRWMRSRYIRYEIAKKG
jgi:dolichol-phosphate mannosyltransferase